MKHKAGLGPKWTPTHGVYQSGWFVEPYGYELSKTGSSAATPLGCTVTFAPERDGPFIVPLGPEEPIRSYLVTPKDPVASPRQLIKYNPLDHPYIHRDFASIDGEEGLIAFANRFGPLGRGLYADDGPKPLYVESHVYWIQEVWGLAYAIKVWNLLSPGPRRDLAKALLDLAKDYVPYVRDFNRGIQVLMPALMYQSIANREWGMDQDSSFVHRSFLRHLHLFVNAQLQGAVTIQISPGQPHCFLIVEHLLGAIYLCFANEVMGNVTLPRVCAHCGFYLPSHLRADAVYCSNTCRQKNHLRNKSRTDLHIAPSEDQS